MALEIFFPTWSLRNLNYTKSNKYITSYIDKNTHTHIQIYKVLQFYILKSLHDNLIINVANYISFKF